MGALLSRDDDVRHHIVIIGLAGSGREEVLKSLFPAEAVSRTEPLPGFHVDVIERAASSAGSTKVTSFGVGDLDRKVWQTYLRGATCFVFVADASDRARFPDLKKVLSFLASLPLMRDPEHPTRHFMVDVPMLLLANKQDVPGAASPADVAAAVGLAEWPGGGLSFEKGGGCKHVLGFSATASSNSPYRFFNSDVLAWVQSPETGAQTSTPTREKELR